MSTDRSEEGGATGLDLEASLHASLNVLLGGFKRVADDLKDMRQLVLQAGLLLPAGTVVGAAGTFPSSGSLVLDLGGPAQGRLWDVARIVVGGITPSTAAAGAADVYVSAAGRSAMPGGLIEWCDTASSLPLNAFYSPGQVFLRYPERLYVVLRSGTSTQQYVTAARIVDRIETPVVRSSDEVGS